MLAHGEVYPEAGEHGGRLDLDGLQSLRFEQRGVEDAHGRHLAGAVTDIHGVEGLLHEHAVAGKLEEGVHVVDVVEARCDVGQHAAVLGDVEVVLLDIAAEYGRVERTDGELLDEWQLEYGVVYGERGLPGPGAPGGSCVSHYYQFFATDLQ